MIYFSARKSPFILGEYDNDIDFAFEAGFPVSDGPWELYAACAASLNNEMLLIGGANPEQRRKVICVLAFDANFHGHSYFRYEKSRIVHYKTLENLTSTIVMVHVIHSHSEFCFVLPFTIIATKWIWLFAIENAFRKFSPEGIIY